MLIQFTVTNFLSFAEKTVMSMRADKAVAREQPAPDIVAETDILRCAALYGANASGKSNLVAALEFAKELVVEGVPERKKIRTDPFRLNKAARDEPSSFDFYIRARSGRTYGYGFAVTAAGVAGEWMSEIVEGEERQLFTRDANSYHFGAALTEGDRTTTQLLDTVAGGTRDNQLLLRTARSLKIEKFPAGFQDIVSWFEDTLTIISPESRYVPLLPEIDDSPAFRDFLGVALRRVDTGVLRIYTKRHPLNEDERRLVETAMSDEEATNSLIFQQDSGRMRACLVRQDHGKSYRLELHLAHADETDPYMEFDLADESDGTIRLLDLAPMLYVDGEASEYHRVYVIDELDRSMHTLLTRWLVEQFLTGDAARTPRQLLFTTHDTNLLDLQLLRPDSVWFAQKDRQGASQIYSLAEYPPEQLNSLCGALEQGYLNGRFGAIPFLGNASRLGWPPRGSE